VVTAVPLEPGGLDARWRRGHACPSIHEFSTVKAYRERSRRARNAFRTVHPATVMTDPAVSGSWSSPREHQREGHAPLCRDHPPRSL